MRTIFADVDRCGRFIRNLIESEPEYHLVPLAQYYRHSLYHFSLLINPINSSVFSFRFAQFLSASTIKIAGAP